MNKIAIVTAANSAFFELVKNWVESIEANVSRQDFDLCLYDLGLNEDHKVWLQARNVTLARPGWDITWPQIKGQPPKYKKYVTVAPFTPRYFPGYDIYVWIDCDAWLQDGRGLDLLIKGAEKGKLAIVPVMDRAFETSLSGAPVRLFPSFWFFKGFRRRLSTYLYNVMLRYYNREAANMLLFKPVLGAGIYALPREAPHWSAWEDSLRKAKFRRGTDLSDQSPLNHAVYTKDLPVELLPSYVNWHCHAGLPAYDEDRELFVEPYLPHEPLSIIHLVGHTKYNEHEVETLSGKARKMSLNFEGRPPIARRK